ncbi:MAG: hypothetical protein N3A66_01410 [Planctomycetota bacterium]|nr:hypothetical protein [Planctomycetota bacterium]
MAEYQANDGSQPMPTLPSALGWLITAAVVSLPLVEMGTGQPSFALLPKRMLHLTLFDLLVWPAALWLLIWRWQCCRGGRGAAPWLRQWLVAVWPAWMLLAAGAISMCQIDRLSRPDLILAAKNACQWLEYLAIFPLLALALLETPVWRPRLYHGLFLGTAIAVGAAHSDFVALLRAGEAGVPPLVGGYLGSRYPYTLFVALAVCVLWEKVSLPAWRIWRWFFAFAAFYPALAAGPLVGGLAGLAFASLAQKPRSVLAFLALAAALAFLPPAEARSQRGRCLARSLQVYVPFRNPESGHIESTHTMRYYRWAAEINALAARPWGAGWGKYQSAINERLGDLPVPKIQSREASAYDVLAHEPMSFSWFLQAGVELGLPGLIAVLLFILEILARSGGWRKAAAISPGVAGAALALFFASIWTSPLVRGVGPLLGLLLALSQEPPAGGEEKEKA